jgi:hypothetical protein
MKKNDLRKLALLGMATAVLVSNQAFAEEKKAAEKKDDLKNLSSITDGNLGYHLYTEDELILELNPEGVALYKSLDPEGKLLARKVASTMCNGMGECKGLGACKSSKNSCVGKNECKGQNVCAHSDKNVAVKLVAKKMAEKRANTTK